MKQQIIRLIEVLKEKQEKETRLDKNLEYMNQLRRLCKILQKVQ